jgi:hypothetical protein
METVAGPWPTKADEALAKLSSLLGPPPEGIFQVNFCPKRCCWQEPRKRQGLAPLARAALPKERQCLTPLTELGLDCLWWEALGRPTAKFCVAQLESTKAEDAAFVGKRDFCWLHEDQMETKAAETAASSSTAAKADPPAAAELPGLQSGTSLAKRREPVEDLEAAEAADGNLADTDSADSQLDDLDLAAASLDNLAFFLKPAKRQEPGRRRWKANSLRAAGK